MEDQKLEDQPKRFLLGTGIFWLVLVIVAAIIGFLLDPIVMPAVAGHSLKPVRMFAGFLSKAGDWPELMLFGLAALVLVRNQRRLVIVILCMMIAATLAGAAVNSVRLLSGRARPNNTEVAPGWYGIQRNGVWLLDKYKYHSFPSGHTGSAVAFFAVLGFAFRRWNWGYLAIGLAIGWSRIYRNVHYFSDVLVGTVVGLYFAQLTWERIGPWLSRRLMSIKHW
jgi:membrane-associated phospholipid phosphatase